MNPNQLTDRSEACKLLGISRQTLIAWIQKGKLKVWKRVGQGSNAALLFERKHIDEIRCTQLKEANALAANATTIDPVQEAVEQIR